jgi:hypothetical protein
MIVFSCPACRNALQVPPTLAGRPVTCSFCHQVMTVPPAQAVPQPAHPQPAPRTPTRPKANTPFSFDDPKREATAPADADAEDRRTQARRAERDAKQRQAAYTYLGLGVVLVLIGIICAISLAPKIMRDSQGSRVLKADELLAIKDPKDLPTPWVSYTTDQAVVETNLGVESERSKGKPLTRFVLVPVKNKWLIVERGVNVHGKTFEGSLETWQGGLYGEAVEKLHAGHRDKSLLPVQLQESWSGPTGQVVSNCLLIGCLFVVGFACMLYGLSSRPRASRKRFG